MRAEIYSAGDLDPAMRSSWLSFRSSQFATDNAFFSPDFVTAAARVIPETEVAIILDGQLPVGFWPMQRRGGLGLPVAARVTEITGPIVNPEAEWNPLEVARQLGIKEWSFDCLPVATPGFAPFHTQIRSFPFIDIAPDDVECRILEQRTESRQFSEWRRKQRKFEKEFGPLQFKWHDDDRTHLATMISWKRRQYQQTGVHDLLGISWVPELLEQILRGPTDDLSAVFSTLCHNDRLLAAHVGLRSGSTLCWWFTAYDSELSRYSPGSILLLKVLETASERGIRRIDLGQGNERYKGSLATGCYPVAEGIVTPNRWKRQFCHAWGRTRDWAESASFCSSALRWFRQARNRTMQRAR